MIKRALATLALTATIGMAVAACNGSTPSPTIGPADSFAPVESPLMSDAPSMAPSESTGPVESVAPSAS